MKLLILFAITIQSLFAGTPDAMPGFWVYTYGDAAAYEVAFNFIASLRHEGDYVDLMQIAFIVGATWTLLIKSFSKEFLVYMVSGTAVVTLIFGNVSTVNVVNVKAFHSGNITPSSYARIDNVPYLFAMVASGFSTIGYNSAKWVEAGFSSFGAVSEVSFLKSGVNGLYTYHAALDKLTISEMGVHGKEFTKKYNGYARSCIMELALEYQPKKVRDYLRVTQNPFDDLSPSKVREATGIDLASEKIYYENQEMTCQELYDMSKDDFESIKSSNEIEKKVIDKYRHSLVDASKTLGATVGLLTKAEQGGNSVTNLQDYVLHMGMMKRLQAEFQGYATGVDSDASLSGAFGSGLATANMYAMGQVNASFFAGTMPAMQSVIRIVMYIAFPFVLAMALAAGTWAIFKNYIMSILWIEMWPLSYSILSYFVNKNASTGALDKLVAYGQKSTDPLTYLTMENVPDIYQSIAMEGAIAANMYMLVPVISTFFFAASYSAFAQVSSQVMGRFSQAGSLDAQNREQLKMDSTELLKNNMGDVDTSNAGWNDMAYKGELGSNVSTLTSQIANIDGGYRGIVDRTIGETAEKIAGGEGAFSNLNEHGQSGLNTAAVQQHLQKTSQSISDSGALQNAYENSSTSGSKEDYRKELTGMDAGLNMSSEASTLAQHKETAEDLNISTSKLMQNIAAGDAKSQMGIGLGNTAFANSTSVEDMASGEKTGKEISLGKNEAFENVMKENGVPTREGARRLAEYEAAAKVGGVGQKIAMAEKLTGLQNNEAVVKMEEEKAAIMTHVDADGNTRNTFWKNDKDGNTTIVREEKISIDSDLGKIAEDINEDGKTVNFESNANYKEFKVTKWDQTYEAVGTVSSANRIVDEAAGLSREEAKTKAMISDIGNNASIRQGVTFAATSAGTGAYILTK